MDTAAALPLRPVEFQILLVLSSGDRHGYGILRAAEERSQGRIVLEPGTLYRALRRLLNAGWVEETTSEASETSEDSRRRYYRLTPAGRQVAAAEALRMESLVLEARDRRLIAEGSEG